jgi:hypothetical protein
MDQRTALVEVVRQNGSQQACQKCKGVLVR